MGSMITANYDSETDQIIDVSPRLNNGVAISSVPVTATLSDQGIEVSSNGKPIDSTAFTSSSGAAKDANLPYPGVNLATVGWTLAACGRTVSPHSDMPYEFSPTLDFATSGQIEVLSGAGTVLNHAVNVSNTSTDTYLKFSRKFRANAFWSISWEPTYISSGAFDAIKVGVIKDQNNFFLCNVDKRRSGGWIEFVWNIAGAPASSAVVTGVAVANYSRFAFTMTAGKMVAWGLQAEDGEWYVLHHANIPVDIRNNDWSGYGYGAACYHDATGTQSIKNIRAGAPGMAGLRDQMWVCYEDGSPYLQGGKMFYTATMAPAQTTDGVGVNGSRCGVFEFNPSSLQSVQVGEIYTSRGGYIYGDHAHKAFYNRLDGYWYLFGCTWGDYMATASADMYYAKSKASVLYGVITLTSITPLNFKGATNFAYDPDVVFDGTKWRMIYTYGAIAGNLVYKESATLAGLATAAGRTLSAFGEGPKLRRIAGAWVGLVGKLNGISLVNLDTGAETATAFSAPAGATYPHPNLTTIFDGARTKYVIHTFNQTPHVAGGQFCWGDWYVYETTWISGSER